MPVLGRAGRATEPATFLLLLSGVWFDFIVSSFGCTLTFPSQQWYDMTCNDVYYLIHSIFSCKGVRVVAFDAWCHSQPPIFLLKGGSLLLGSLQSLHSWWWGHQNWQPERVFWFRETLCTVNLVCVNGVMRCISYCYVGKLWQRWIKRKQFSWHVSIDRDLIEKDEILKLSELERWLTMVDLALSSLHQLRFVRQWKSSCERKP